MTSVDDDEGWTEVQCSSIQSLKGLGRTVLGNFVNNYDLLLYGYKSTRTLIGC